MLTCDYKVLSIDGDYAHLERQDSSGRMNRNCGPCTASCRDL